MRALLCREFGPPDSLSIEDTDDPIPSDFEVLVDVAAAGVNFPDLLAIAGKYQVRAPLPFVPGNEAAGTVINVGNGVSRISVGDEVLLSCSGGAFARKCVAPEDRVMRMPKSLTPEQGAGFSVAYGTSYHALRQSANLAPGETVLVLGAAGGVGIAAVEIAKAMGARVIAAASSDRKLAFAEGAGADELINYSSQSLRESVRTLTGDAGVDVVVDPVGGDLAGEALRATAWHGRYLVIGFASGTVPKMPANLALLKEASIIGVWWGPWMDRNPALQQLNMHELTKFCDAGEIRPRVSATYHYTEFGKAFAEIAERRVLGKVVLRFDGS